MKKELYKQRYFIQKLEKDIKAVMKNSDLGIDFNMPKKEYNKLDKSLKDSFNRLLCVLFEYTTDDLQDKDKYAHKIKKQCQVIISIIQDNLTSDNFYEDKLSLFEKYCNSWVNHLVEIYPEFAEHLNDIEMEYLIKYYSKCFGSKSTYLYLVDLYSYIHTSLYKISSNKAAKDYMIHSAELIIKDIDDLFIHDVLHYNEKKDPEARKNMIRKVVFLLKLKLHLNLD